MVVLGESENKVDLLMYLDGDGAARSLERVLARVCTRGCVSEC